MSIFLEETETLFFKLKGKPPLFYSTSLFHLGYVKIKYNIFTYTKFTVHQAYKKRRKFTHTLIS